MEEEGNDNCFNIRAKLLQLIPDSDLCSLLYKGMKRHEHAVTQLGISMMDKKRLGEGCLNEVLIDIRALE